MVMLLLDSYLNIEELMSDQMVGESFLPVKVQIVFIVLFMKSASQSHEN